MRRESQGDTKKEDKILIPEAQQCKLTKSLHDATSSRRDVLWDLMQKVFSVKGLKRTVKYMLVIYVPTITHRPIQSPPSLFRSVQHQDTYLEEHWQLDFIQMYPLSGYNIFWHLLILPHPI